MLPGAWHYSFKIYRLLTKSSYGRFNFEADPYTLAERIRMVWYEEEVRRVEQEYLKLSAPPETVFFGSSSFTLWDSLYEDFAALKPINLGFGGSTIAACNWFFDRIMKPLGPVQRIIIYAGDNDLGDGRHPTEVCLFYRQLIGHIRQRFGGIPSYYIAIKPSVQRWQIIADIRLANKLIRTETIADPLQHYIDIFGPMLTDTGLPEETLFEEDGLHLSRKGYALWQKIILENLNDLPNSFLNEP